MMHKSMRPQQTVDPRTEYYQQVADMVDKLVPAVPAADARRYAHVIRLGESCSDYTQPSTKAYVDYVQFGLDRIWT